MAHAFSRTLRSIESGGKSHRTWIALVAVLTLGAWGVWLVCADVPVYASSADARLVVDRALFPLEAPVAGRVVALRAALEDHVETGAVVVELDASDQRAALAEENARHSAIDARFVLSEREIAAQEHALADANSADEAARREAALMRERHTLAVQIADEEAQRLEQLGETGASKLTISKARSEAAQARVSLAVQTVAVERLALEQRRIASEHEASIAALRRGLAELEGARALSTATIARLEHDVELRAVRASAAGEIGELARLAPGSFVSAGQRLGIVLARGELAAEAHFAPGDALGRVHVGQRGELRLDAFPWTQYGALSVTVAHISGEARDGLLRVEFALDGAPPLHIPLEHGLPGRIAVEVDRASPFELVLRSVGHSGARATAALTPSVAEPRR